MSAATILGMLMGAVAHGAPGPVGPELTVARSRPLALSPRLSRGGRVEQRELALHGLPVRGAYETVRVLGDGSEQVLSSSHPTAAPQLRPSDARIPAADVPALVAAHLDLHRNGDREPQLEGPPILVYLMVLGHPVLAWETQLALSLRPEPSRPTVWVSAATGRVLREREQVRASRARVFAENPSKTPVPVQVELYDIHVEDAGHPLVGPRVQAFNCLGEEPDEVSPWWDEDECWPVQTVFSNDDGDFFVPTPNVVLVQDNIDRFDPYAELSMYVHAERFLEAMREKGIEQFKCEFSSMLANVHTLEPSSSFDYSPLNNAYYTNQCDPEKGPTMLFGQGSEVDFGYDGDVVYHELGHGMVALLAPDNLGDRRLRSDASLVDAGALNESLADYFSVMLTDDPRLAEYVGRFWSGIGSPSIRDAENSRTCPDDIVGQSHNDGEPFTAALWATRKRLSQTGKEALDRAVIEALMRMPPDIALEEAAALVLEQADLEVQDGSLHPDDWTLLQRSFDARGLLHCPRVITDPTRVDDGRSMNLRRADSGIHPFHPAPMQLRYEVPPNADDMVVAFTLRPRGSDDPVEGLVLVKRGDAPIEFEYQLVAVDDPPLEPPEDPTGLEDPVRELVLVTGDWDLELAGTEVTDDDYVVTLGGLEPGEVLHVTVVDASPTDASVSGFLVRSSAALPDDAADGGSSSDDGGEGPGAAVDRVVPGEGAAGCACRASVGDRRGAGGGPWAHLLLLGLRRARRRRP
ncbi:hypothetical protein OEB96_17495 [Paraliomyxa miuraensis]|nr:hypothetical protein [Paraliomyxa miuraensis]